MVYKGLSTTKQRIIYRANFNNDVVADEMERIMSEVLLLQSFGVFDFLTIYKRLDNPFRLDNYFHNKNNKKPNRKLFEVS